MNNTTITRNTIFISHASPDDDEFTIWLASRLKLIGYEVWIDKNQLLGGEKFWEEIDLTIRNKTIKFLLVYSESICQKDSSNNPIPGKLKDGVSKEFILADSISKQEDLKEFMLLLNKDGSDFNLFIDAPRLNQISFYNNWASGFNQLIKKLQKDNVSTNEYIRDDNFGDWYKNQYLSVEGIIEKTELYHSNWWEIKLPEYFYIYRFSNETQAKEIYNQYTTYPISRIANVLSSFENFSQFEINYQADTLTIKPDEIFTIKISDVLLGFNSEKFPTQLDCENNLKYLLNRVFHLLMKSRKLYWHKLANKKNAYYYTLSNLPSSKVRFSYPYRSEKSRLKYKRKNLIGDYLSLGKWHVAISSKTILSPLVAFSIKVHLIFTSDGYNLIIDANGLIDTERMHRFRRKKGKRLFNEDWRDMLLGFLFGLTESGKIEVDLSSTFKLDMSQYPVNFWADFGYLDPQDKTRQGILSESKFDEIGDTDELGEASNDK